MNQIFTQHRLKVLTLSFWSIMLSFDCCKLMYIELTQDVTRHQLMADNWGLMMWILIEAFMVYSCSSGWFYTGFKNDR